MSEQLGNYRLLKLLATGGMGEIWLARQQGLAGFDRLAVVKRILPHLARSRKFVRMFVDEARLAANLSHPHIVPIYDWGRIGETFYIAMEYVHGENLRVVNRESSARPAGAMPPYLVARVISQAAEALDYAHTRKDERGQSLGIVHRDMSPQNLILSYEGQIKVVDFGIAKAVGRTTHTRVGDRKGKIVYMSPEQVRSEELDHRSDIFSLGIVLWELSTGARLYREQESEFLVLQAICEQEPPRPRDVRRTVPTELEAIILRALEKDPNDRYQTAGEMHLDLERFLQASSQVVSSNHLAEYMRGLFPEREERFSILKGEKKTPDEKLLSRMSSLFEEPRSSSSPAGGRHPSQPSRGGREPTPSFVPPPVPPPLPISSSQKQPPASRLHFEREEAIGWLDEARDVPSADRLDSRASSPPEPPLAHTDDEDDIDLANVVDPYAEEPTHSLAAPSTTGRRGGYDVGLEESLECGPEQELSIEEPAASRSRDRARTSSMPGESGPPFLSGLKGRLEDTRHLVATAWYSLPGRGRLATGTSSLFRLAGLATLLLCTAWLLSGIGRSLAPSLNLENTSQIVDGLKERVVPARKTSIRIVSFPPRATVVLDGDVVGITPYADRITRAEAIEVELRSPGYQTWRRTVIVGDDDLELEVPLQRR